MLKKEQRQQASLPGSNRRQATTGALSSAAGLGVLVGCQDSSAGVSVAGPELPNKEAMASTAGCCVSLDFGECCVRFGAQLCLAPLDMGQDRCTDDVRDGLAFKGGDQG